MSFLVGLLVSTVIFFAMKSCLEFWRNILLVRRYVPGNYIRSQSVIGLGNDLQQVKGSVLITYLSLVIAGVSFILFQIFFRL
ncbi:hypothetical protein [Bacillus sp. 2205SS5-2]|uniref:hypothetical protein n=1 Tax=Bacillus sp. 2205SS5-2 TaxID=3109031 RepID=UPI003004D678